MTGTKANAGSATTTTTAATNKVAPTKRQAARITRKAPLKKRMGPAAIRAMWTVVFGGVGSVVTYLSDTGTVVGLGAWSVPIALGVGGLCYGLKKLWWPDTKW